MMDTTLVWLRQDLRLGDHPALTEAAKGKVLLAYVLEEDGPWRPGAASCWWLHYSLAALSKAVAAKGGALVLARGRAIEEIPSLAAASGATKVMWNRRYEPHERAREDAMAERLRLGGFAYSSHPGNLLFEPGTVRTKGGGPFQVFTAFWRCAQTLPPPPLPLPAPARLTPPTDLPKGLPLAALELMPKRDWWQGLATTWQPGEAGAAARLADFLAGPLEGYDTARDRPDLEGTSRLSPHLTFGEISPRQIWQAIQARPPCSGAETFLKELGWREFSYALLAQHPTLPQLPIKTEFNGFPWATDSQALEAWRHGRTGYPIVDAGLRQLWATGWMHNRVRMIVGSFLVKDLLIPWQRGEEWFWDTLVDADLAANAASWQWVSGSGADAAPFFRIFNPVLQGEKFDPNGTYVRHWLPELAALPDRFIHQPWQAGLRLDARYPPPMVDHGMARKRALAAFARLKGL